MDILEGLNPQQRRAVEHVNGPLLVVAGAGTGKTQVITRRIAHLIQSGAAAPHEILALTFTEKAAREMSDRLHQLIGWESFQVPIMTFNAFGSELLGRFASHVGRSTRGGLLNTIQKTLLLVQRFDDLDLKYYGPPHDLYEFMEKMVKYIEGLQNSGISAAEYRKFVDGLEPDSENWLTADILEQQDLAAIYELYESIKAETGTYDYSDQLVTPLSILRERPNLAQRLSKQYRYVLVDEYQDTSPIQDALLREIIKPGGNIFAVGDDDQAIYGFRGADITNILGFADHFGVKQAEALVQNYRSGQPILDASYRLIGNNNPDRLEVRLGINKRLMAQHYNGVVKFTPYRTSADEQTAIVEAIAARVAAGEVPSSIAVLARTNTLLRNVSRALRRENIPFAMSTEVNIFEQRELIHLWYLLEWLSGRAKEESIAHVMMGPFIQWTAAECRDVMEQAQNELETIEAVLRRAVDGRAQELFEKLNSWREWASEMPISQLVYRLVFETGMSERLIALGEKNERVVRVFDDLHTLMSQMQDYETVAMDPTLTGYMATFPKPPVLEATEAVGDANGVQLLTVHASKGLEFEIVYVMNCSARSWSERVSTGLVVPEELRQADQLPAVHEQRRLMYVAATRAKKELYLSAAIESAGGQKQAISPLIEELLGEAPELGATVVTRESEKMLQKLQRFYPLQKEMRDAKLSFETADGWIELGVGALGLYKRCPHEFYLQHVLRITQPFGPQLAFGTAVHGAIQAYYEAHLRGEKMGVAETLARVEELWSDRGYETAKLAEMAKERARQSVVAFVAREESEQERRILGTELKIVLELPEYKLRLRGRIDAYYQIEDGVEIRDFKTGSKRNDEKLAVEAKDNFQLRTYALAYELMTGKAPAVVTLDYVVTGAVGTAKLTPRILTNHRAKLGELAEKIRERDFAPAPASEYHQCAAFMYYGEESDEEEAVTQ